jgi:hypothetical protein
MQLDPLALAAAMGTVVGNIQQRIPGMSLKELEDDIVELHTVAKGIRETYGGADQFLEALRRAVPPS